MRFNSRCRIRVRETLSVFLLVSFLFVFIQVAREHFARNSLRWIYNIDDTFSFHQNTSSVLPMKNPVDVSSFQPFIADQPKFLVILAYQRTGSTFLGRFLSKHPNVFYMFEPIDSLYSSVYGTIPGWNVPSDITNYRNGSLRVLSEEELTMVSEFMRSLLTCELAFLPTETFVHQYILKAFVKEFSVGQDYVKCLLLKRKEILKCSAFKPFHYCGGRFGEQPEKRQLECRALLNDGEFRGNHQHRRIFNGYLSCMSQLRALMDTDCIPHLLDTCLSQPIRVTKVVRATMDSMEPLLRDLPNFRVIHLLRDPRGVALSRKKFDGSGSGLYSGTNRNLSTVREAGLYCQTAVRDLNASFELDRKYPGKIMRIVYEDLVRNVEKTIHAIYRFLDLEIPSNISQAILSAANSSKGLTSANKWQTDLSFKTCKDIWSTCDEFFRTVDYNWEG